MVNVLKQLEMKIKLSQHFSVGPLQIRGKITNKKERSQNSTSYMYMVYWGVHIPNLLEYITHECLAKHYVLFATFVFVYSMELKFLANSLQKCLLLLFFHV